MLFRGHKATRRKQVIKTNLLQQITLTKGLDNENASYLGVRRIVPHAMLEMRARVEDSGAEEESDLTMHNERIALLDYFLNQKSKAKLAY